MTELQKDTLISKMIENAYSLSDEELDMIVHDEELREIYEMSSAVKGTYLSHREFDMDKEWKLFQSRNLSGFKRAGLKWIFRAAAVVLLLVCLPAIVVKMHKNNPDTANQHITADLQHTASLKSFALTTVVAEDSVAPVENFVLSEIKVEHKSSHRPFNVRVKESESEMLFSEEDLDIEQYLRIEQASIDNDLAMQNAEIYREEYEAIREIIGEDENLDGTLTTIISKVTMQ